MICNTNNETERINEELKYEDLDRCFNSHISELLTIIVKEFLPRRYEWHVQMKVFCSSGFKKHQLEMPSYLWNPPKTILRDILKKMGIVSPEMIASIKPVPNLPNATYLAERNSIHGKGQRNTSPPTHGSEGIVHFANISLLSLKVDMERLKTLHHSKDFFIFCAVIFDEYLFQQENENDYLIRIFIFAHPCCKYILAGAFVLSY